MATGVTTQSPFFENPYLTVTEYKNAPTAIDFDNLVVGGNAGAQDAELANVILRASSFIDEYLNQNLNASTQTENQRIRLSNSGYLAIHPNNNPVISLQSMSYGTDPNGLTTLSDPSKAWFEGQQLVGAAPHEFAGYAPQLRACSGPRVEAPWPSGVKERQAREPRRAARDIPLPLSCEVERDDLALLAEARLRHQHQAAFQIDGQIGYAIELGLNDGGIAVGQ